VLRSVAGPLSEILAIRNSMSNCEQLIAVRLAHAHRVLALPGRRGFPNRRRRCRGEAGRTR
jgi:hypothetical protein